MKIAKISAAACVLCSAFTTSGAIAQSHVTLFGLINTTMEYQKWGGDKKTAMESNESLWGIQGTEDLGGGLKAGFYLESGFLSDSGAGAQGQMRFDRISQLSLEGHWGQLRMGRFYPQSYVATALMVSLHNFDAGYSADWLYDHPQWFGHLDNTNKIAYATPNMGGLILEGAVSFHEKNTPEEKYGYDFSAMYDAGNLGLGAGYTKVGKTSQWALRASHSFGPLKLAAYFQRYSEKDPLGGSMRGTRNNGRIAAMFMLDDHNELHVNAGHAGKWSNISDSAATQWTLVWNYHLSKRTKLYSYYTKMDNKRGADYITGVAGDNFSSLALGMAHSF